MYILGVSAYYHDAAAALLKDGRIVAAAQEERFTRKKHDSGFPLRAIDYCLDEAGISLSDLNSITFYDKPLIKFERLLETYIQFAPKGFKSFVMAMPVWLKEKLFLKSTIRKSLADHYQCDRQALPQLLFAEHHQSHAASAFFPSPFEDAAVLCLDGVGEWATTSLWSGKGNGLQKLWQLDFPHSLGLLYSAFTYYVGFKVNSGEYKLMGLAPYGEPRYVQTIRDHLVDIKDDGTFRLDMSFFDFATGLRMTNRKFSDLFGGPARRKESEISQRDMDLARSIQVVTEEIVVRLAKTAQREVGSRNLCLAGGVALNCVANGKLLQKKIFDNLWIQPAAGDAGGSLGAAYAAWHQFLGQQRQIPSKSGAPRDAMRGSYLGPDFSCSEIEETLRKFGAVYERCDTESTMLDQVSTWLAEGGVVGWFQGRMEFGPRALGARSILGDPRSSDMQKIMNLKIKFRESFRPFAPAILGEEVANYFELGEDSPYMLIVANVKEEHMKPVSDSDAKKFGMDKLKVVRSKVPAITHVDGSARVQTVHDETNPIFYRLVRSFKRKTGCPMLINTSFNVRGEPIVCTPEDAFRCFMRTEMDYLVLGTIVLKKSDQPAQAGDDRWKEEFELD